MNTVGKEKRCARGGADLASDTRGLTTVEYLILLCLVCVVGLAAWESFGSTLGAKTDGVTATFDSQLPSTPGGAAEPGDLLTGGDGDDSLFGSAGNDDLSASIDEGRGPYGCPAGASFDGQRCRQPTPNGLDSITGQPAAPGDQQQWEPDPGPSYGQRSGFGGGGRVNVLRN